MEKMLSPEILKGIQKRLGGLKDPVKCIAFVSERQGPHGGHVQALVHDVALLHPKLSVETYTLEAHPGKFKAYGIDKLPALVLENIQGKQARFFGLPAGEEFNVFLTDLLDLSRGGPELPHDIVRQVQQISTPMHLQVFVNDSCPYCPGMVRLTHGMAMLNPHIRADMVRIEEFRALADKHNVMGVPHTVVNGKSAFRGAIPSDVFMKRLKEMQQG